MRTIATTRLTLLAAAVVAGATLAIGAAPGTAGTFNINICQADAGLERYSTQAFGEYATRGMRWKRACNPAGAGLRGLVTGNVVRSGRVKPGAQSRFVLDAPPGTRFLNINWSGEARRRDCRYSLQFYAWRPDGPPKAIRNFRANRNCARKGHMQVAVVGVPRPRQFNIAGASRIVQRVVCQGNSRKRFCSARSLNWLATYYAQATVLDLSAPAVGIVQDNPFTQGAWVRGGQNVSYNVSDNVGVKAARPVISGADGRVQHDRPCDYALPVPCTNDPGQISIETDRLGEGTQPLHVQAIDAADNANTSAAVTVRIDNGAPAAAPLTVEGGDGWRAANSYAVDWVNANEGDRAPIAAAHWQLCRAGTSQCTTGSQPGAGISRLEGLKVPEPGEWDLRVAREDAAGNRNDSYASEPVGLRWDPEPPTLSFEAGAAGDPTRVSVAVADRVSGVAGGAVEISAAGSNSWQTLDTRLEGGRLVARIPDETLAPGSYVLRAQARDLADNIGTAAAGPINLPLRIVSAMQAGVAVTKTVTKTVTRKRGQGKKARKVRRKLRRQETVLRPIGQVDWAGHATLMGRLTNRDGQPLPGQPIQVLGPGPNGEQVLAVLTSDGQGGFSYRAAGSEASRTLRFVYQGSPLVLPTQTQVELQVPAAGSFKASRKRVLNGGRVVFRGRVASVPLPALGKLVEIQVKQPTGEWTTFRTLRTDTQGQWALRYRFRRTACHTRYRLRAHIPAEAGYPFTEGHSRPRSVLVRGARGACP